EFVPEQFIGTQTLRVTALGAIAGEARFACAVCNADVIDLKEAARALIHPGADPDLPLLAELRDILHLFDRDPDASNVERALRKEAGGDPALIEVIVHGLQEDLPELFVRRLADDPLRRRFNHSKSIATISWPTSSAERPIDQCFSD